MYQLGKWRDEGWNDNLKSSHATLIREAEVIND